VPGTKVIGGHSTWPALGPLGSLVVSPSAAFRADTWLQIDVCVSPLPFADKSVDFLICSHTLEDIRNPIWLCQEINRVAKRGYIEIPSRRMESIRNLEHRGYPGYYHHRWLVEVEGHDVVFRFKTPLMSSSWKFTLPSRTCARSRARSECPGSVGKANSATTR
jgi:hypothetical protein